MLSKRGRLLHEAITGKWYIDSVRGQIEIFLGGLVILVIGIFLIFQAVILVPSDKISWMLAIIGALFCVPFGIVAMYVQSFSKDQIYEKGISSLTHSFKDFLKRNTFHRYEDILKIGEGVHKSAEGKQLRFLLIYTNNGQKPATALLDRLYKNDFFDKLIEVLKEKCPNAQWVEGDWKFVPLFA